MIFYLEAYTGENDAPVASIVAVEMTTRQLSRVKRLAKLAKEKGLSEVRMWGWGPDWLNGWSEDGEPENIDPELSCAVCYEIGITERGFCFYALGKHDDSHYNTQQVEFSRLEELQVKPWERK